MTAGLLHVDRIRATVQTRRIGRRIEYVHSTTSTNDLAWRFVESSGEFVDGWVIFAEHQSAGRGRFGRSWQSPRGASLMASIIVQDAEKQLAPAEIPLLVGVAACDAVRQVTDVPATIKWPNDLMVGAKKAAGILVEARTLKDGDAVYVLGIGINCLQQSAHFKEGELADEATSLEIESDRPIDRTNLAIALIEALDRWFYEPGAWNSERLRDAWLSRSDAIGARVRLRIGAAEHSGTIVSLDPMAGLVVDLDEGGRRIFDAAYTTIAAYSVLS